MKIYSDRSVAGYPSEKTDKQSKTAKKSDSNETIQFDASADDLALESKNPAVLSSVLDGGNEMSSSVEFDVREVPLMKQRLADISSYIRANPFEALSAHSGLTSESVARLLV